MSEILSWFKKRFKLIERIIYELEKFQSLRSHPLVFSLFFFFFFFFFFVCVILCFFFFFLCYIVLFCDNVASWLRDLLFSPSDASQEVVCWIDDSPLIG